MVWFKFSKATIGKGCCLPSESDFKKAKIISIVLGALEIGLLVAILILNEIYFHLKIWWAFPFILGIPITVLSLMYLWDLKMIFIPNHEEMFSLTIQGSHQRNISFGRRTKRLFMGIIVTDTQTKDVYYERNYDGIMVFFTRFSGSNALSSPYDFPFQGWFTFFHILIIGPLIACFVKISYFFIRYDDLNSLTLCVLMGASILSHLGSTITTYYRATDCCCDIGCIVYTRAYKHTNSYTEMIQQSILSKHGPSLKEDGDRLDYAIKQITHGTVRANRVVLKDVIKGIANRYDDQLVLLNLLLAQHHNQAAKQVLPEYNVDNQGVPFLLTMKEIRILDQFAKKENEHLTDVTIHT